MKSACKRGRKKTPATRQTALCSSQSDDFARVMRALEAAGKTGPNTDPLVERLQKCPETFIAGEMLGKIFDALKYSRTSAEDDERLTPPAGAVLPLV